MLAAQADSAPVLISGGSGTGKGAIARWIHEGSPRSAKPCLTANRMSPIAEQLPAAQGGTLIVPELGEWPLVEQRVLAGFLRTRTIENPDGSDTRRLLNVRIIANSSQNLEGRAQGGLFSPELLERVGVFRIDMPSLVRRRDEFDDIVLGVLGEIVRELHKEYLRALSPEAWDRLRLYEWPGNIRELRNVLRLAVLTAPGDQIESTDLPDFGADRIDFRATREHFERIYLAELLKTVDGDLERTSQLSRLDPATLRRKLEAYALLPGAEPS